MTVLFEDNHILVCIKPAGMKTQTGKISEKDMVSEVNNYLNKEAKRAGKKACPVFLIHRLDEPVAGLLVFAKTKEAAAILNKEIREDRFKKKYFALVSGWPGLNNLTKEENEEKDDKEDKESQEGQVNKGNKENKEIYTLVDYLIKDNKDNKAFVVSKDNSEAKKAVLDYSIVSRGRNIKAFSLSDKEYSLLDISLHTGRFHQIRCQLSNAGFPIVGDIKYGGEEIKDLMVKRKGIGLIAYELSFYHPMTKKEMVFRVDDSYLDRFKVI